MRRKVYGQSKHTPCITCGKQSTTKNTQNLPSCKDHTKIEHNMKCVCGEWLDMKTSKYGPFFVCIDCGTVSYARAMEMNNLPLPRLEDL